jgi:hypothetical protein
MPIRADQGWALAYLLSFMAYGERIAHECALQQTRFAPTEKARRFLQGQARQELMHAKVFETAADWLAPRRSECVFASLEHYHALLQEAIKRKDFAETLLAEQLILESLGEVILRRLTSGLNRRAIPVDYLCRRLLAQEQTHHAFGNQVLESVIDAGDVSRESLWACGQDYLSLMETMLTSLADEFGVLDEDVNDYLIETRRHLPDWLTSNMKVNSRAWLPTEPT